MDSLLANEFFQTMSVDPSQYLIPSLKENVKRFISIEGEFMPQGAGSFPDIFLHLTPNLICDL